MGGHSDAGYDAFVAGRSGSEGGTHRPPPALGALHGAFTRAAAAYLPIPSSLAEMWERARDFAWAKLPPGMGGNTNALGGAGERCTTPHLMIISSDGYFYAYSIDLERGGELSSTHYSNRVRTPAYSLRPLVVVLRPFQASQGATGIEWTLQTI
ncbi:hypothetical protein C8R45DRAFT_920194 [Mycena sanguinolenta]|nr:hypothetical protein C8R45DRAFT_920194 [Mycena sanguinolenta]